LQIFLVYLSQDLFKSFFKLFCDIFRIFLLKEILSAITVFVEKVLNLSLLLSPWNTR